MNTKFINRNYELPRTQDPKTNILKCSQRPQSPNQVLMNDPMEGKGNHIRNHSIGHLISKKGHVLCIKLKPAISDQRNIIKALPGTRA